VADNHHRIQIVRAILETIVYLQQYVSPVDIFVKIGYLQPVHVQDWKKGRIPYLESVIQCNLHKITFVMKCFRNWALQQGLIPSETAYLASTKGERKDLQFCKNGDPKIESFYRTHYVSPQLKEKKLEKLKEKLEKPPELVAFIILKESVCSRCHKELDKGSFLFMEADQPLCMKCAGFDHLLFFQVVMRK
jgi:hypothetical protein